MESMKTALGKMSSPNASEKIVKKIFEIISWIW
jgi:hypothetical protein